MQLTESLALWADTELHINPEPICDFLRFFQNCEFRRRYLRGKIVSYRQLPTIDEIETIVGKAKSTLDRISAATQVLADGKTDGKKNNKNLVPENPEVAKLAKRIKKELPKGGNKTDIARDFADGNEKKAQSLLRKLRDYPNLLE